MKLVTNVVMNNVEDVEERKEERDFDNNVEMALPTTVVPGQERLLDAVHIDDDMDETKSLIREQCRRCKWSCPVESYIVSECQCTRGPAEELEEDMQALDLEANIMGEDIAEWSELDDTHEMHSVHGNSTEGEVTDTSSDDMLPLVAAEDDSDYDVSEVPALLNNFVLTMPAYPTLPIINIQYLDDTIDTSDIICSQYNLPHYGSYESHVFKCNRHIYCAYHNR
jgi:hypothetical protein